MTSIGTLDSDVILTLLHRRRFTENVFCFDIRIQFPTLFPICLPCFHLSRWIPASALLESISMWVFTAWAPSRRSFLGTIEWSLSRREAVKWCALVIWSIRKWTSTCKHKSILNASYGTEVAQMSRGITGCRSISSQIGQGLSQALHTKRSW